jgi:hypothetical protein
MNIHAIRLKRFSKAVRLVLPVKQDTAMTTVALLPGDCCVMAQCYHESLPSGLGLFN